jgi:hypothetical protein
MAHGGRDVHVLIAVMQFMLSPKPFRGVLQAMEPVVEEISQEKSQQCRREYPRDARERKQSIGAKAISQPNRQSYPERYIQHSAKRGPRNIKPDISCGIQFVGYRDAFHDKAKQEKYRNLGQLSQCEGHMAEQFSTP